MLGGTNMNTSKERILSKQSEHYDIVKKIDVQKDLFHMDTMYHTQDEVNQIVDSVLENKDIGENYG